MGNVERQIPQMSGIQGPDEGDTDQVVSHVVPYMLICGGWECSITETLNAVYIDSKPLVFEKPNDNSGWRWGGLGDLLDRPLELR